MPLRKLDTVTSTMDSAREMLHGGEVNFNPAGLAEPRGVLAHHQTAGRGQRANAWVSKPGEGLYLTLFISHGLRFPEDSRALAFLTGIAVVQSLLELSDIPEETLGLKWPNDMLLNHSKLGGILIETVSLPDHPAVALAGIGVNLAIADLPNELNSLATSLAKEGFTVPDSEVLASMIAVHIDTLAQEYRERGFRYLINLWRTYDRTAGILYAACLEDGIREGIARGVDDEGNLILWSLDGVGFTATSASSLRVVG